MLFKSMEEFNQTYNDDIGPKRRDTRHLGP